jgi:hypothetical protein
MQAIQSIISFVVEAVWQVWPAFLLCIGLDVLFQMLKFDGAIRRALGARLGLAIVLATLVGAFSPFCSCTVVPVVSGLLLSGVPLAPVMASGLHHQQWTPKYSRLAWQPLAGRWRSCG